MDKRRFDAFRDAATVLVVDDAASIRAQIRGMLNAERIDDDRIHEAATGEEALELYRAHDPDLVLLDVNLPDTPGWTIGEHMLEERPDAQVALLTGLDPEHPRVRELVSTGVVDVIEKPLREEDVRELLLLIARRHDTVEKPEQGGFFGVSK